MRISQFFILLFFCVSFSVQAEEDESFSIFSGLQKLGINLGQANQQELLPPDQAFKLSINVRDAKTLIANFEPAKDYYLYRDKIAFESEDSSTLIKKYFPATRENER